MQSVENKTVLVRALVSQSILEIRMKVVGQNAFLTVTAHQIEHVSEINVRIHVRELVAKMLNVKLSTIYQHVHASKVTQEIPLDSVISFLQVRIYS